jgi:acetylglutamate/LysW-gamma-L-alpha-aminoadipate kinase
MTDSDSGARGGAPIVVKIGGASGIAGDGLASLYDDLARHLPRGSVIVHGGSDGATRLSEKLGIAPRFIESPDGQRSRFTGRAELEAFVMATALVNRTHVEALQARGLRAFGMSGLDGGLVRGARKDAVRAVESGKTVIVRDQWTGAPRAVDGALLEGLVALGLVPVVAPVIASERGEMLNTDADRLAAAIAVERRAELLVLLTNVPGLLADPADPSSLVQHIPADELDDHRRGVHGGMAKKLLAAQAALAGGVASVVIADARRPEPLTRALAGHGTVIGAPLAALHTTRTSIT